MKMRIESIKNRLKSYVYKIIKKINIKHKLDYDKISIYMHDNTRLTSCKREPDTVRWIESFNKGDVAFDVGANAGAYSLIMSKYANKVYAFEPSVFTFSTLVKNIYTNRATNIIPLNMALSKSKKIGTFTYSSIISGSSVHSFDADLSKQIYKQDILSYSIDELVADFKIEHPNHIKLDVDGSEFDILKGAVGTLANNNFKSLLVEAADDSEQLFAFLESAGLKEAERHNLLGFDDMHNYLFVKERK